MTNDDFLDELLREASWRFKEVTQLKNLVAREASLQERDFLRKSLVLVLYSHFEGFCIFALGHYQAAINRAQIRCREAVPSIVAGSWEPLFKAVEHGDAQCRIFRRPLPSDLKLHRHWRRRHFVDEIERLKDLIIEVPDDVIDSESNLKPHVLQRNLFVLGLDHAFVDPHEQVIHNLLERRNRIAHGEDRRGVQEREYEGYEDAVVDICYKLIEFLDDAHRKRRFARTEPL